MLLLLDNTNPESVNKLLSFARENYLQLSLVDDANGNYFLPGKPLTEPQLEQLIDSSRKSGMLSLKDAHQIIRNNYHAD
ncbi:MAG: hypothetical protein ABJA85_05735 [Bacteroidota bacterium]